MLVFAQVRGKTNMSKKRKNEDMLEAVRIEKRLVLSDGKYHFHSPRLQPKRIYGKNDDKLSKLALERKGPYSGYLSFLRSYEACSKVNADVAYLLAFSYSIQNRYIPNHVKYIHFLREPSP